LTVEKEHFLSPKKTSLRSSTRGRVPGGAEGAPLVMSKEKLEGLWRRVYLKRNGKTKEWLLGKEFLDWGNRCEGVVPKVAIFFKLQWKEQHRKRETP